MVCHLGWTFTFLGLCTSVLWNQVLLSADVLILLFGNMALSRALFAQSVLSLSAMVLVTAFPPKFSKAAQITATALLYAAMVAAGLVTMYFYHLREMSMTAFLVLSSAFGLLTGLVQLQVSSLAGFLSQHRTEKDGSLASAMLIGNMSSPLVTTLIFAVANIVSSHQQHADPFDRSILTLVCAVALVMCGILLTLSGLNTEKFEAPKTEHLGQVIRNEEGQKYFKKAMRRLSSIGAADIGVFAESVAIAPEGKGAKVSILAGAPGRLIILGAPWLPLAEAIAVTVLCWSHMLTQVPFMTEGLCAGAPMTMCAQLPSLMLGAANIAAFLGTVVGNRLLTVRVLNEYILAEVVVYAIVAVAGTYKATVQPVSQPVTIGVAWVFGLVLWANLILSRLFAKAQHTMDHSMARKCPVTSQVTWVALHIGSVLGTSLSFFHG